MRCGRHTPGTMPSSQVSSLDPTADKWSVGESASNGNDLRRARFGLGRLVVFHSSTRCQSERRFAPSNVTLGSVSTVSPRLSACTTTRSDCAVGACEYQSGRWRGSCPGDMQSRCVSLMKVCRQVRVDFPTNAECQDR
jgi:hypothetical protein